MAEEEVYQGVDCCKDYENQVRDIRITPASYTAEPNEVVRLYCPNFHIIDCDPGCLEWQIVQGGGTLTKNYGDETGFVAPSENPDCTNNAIVALICAGNIVDLCYIATNVSHRSILAYRVSRFEPKRYYRPKDIYPLESAAKPPPAEAESRVYDIDFMWREYTCDGKFMQEYPRYRYTFYWFYNPVKGKWQLQYGATSTVFDIYDTAADIPIEAIHEYFPRVEDRRTKDALKGGCCPGRLWRPGDEEETGGI